MNMKRNQNNNLRKGFTFIEVILYIVIVILILSAIIPFAWNVINLGVKSNTQQEVYAQARFISERLKYEARNSNGIDDSSDFNVNLASDGDKKVAFSQVDSSELVTFSVIDGRVFMKRGIDDAVALQSIDTKITQLIFTNYSSGDGATKNIGFTVTIEAHYPQAGGRQEYQESVTLESGAEVRNN